MPKSHSKRRVLSKVVKDSTAIRKISYNPQTEVLTIEMQFGTQGQGKRLRYGGVPKYVFDELSTTKSKGGYFNSSIRDVFDFLGEE